MNHDATHCADYKKANKSEYTLDEIGDVIIQKNKVLFEIPCEW